MYHLFLKPATMVGSGENVEEIAALLPEPNPMFEDKRTSFATLLIAYAEREATYIPHIYYVTKD